MVLLFFFLIFTAARHVFLMQLWVNNYVTRGHCLTTYERIRTLTRQPAVLSGKQALNSSKKERKCSDLQSEDEVEIFLCRSYLSHHPPQICSCSS